MKPRPDKNNLDAMSNNLNNWKGVIYINHKDYRLFVPKRYPSLGWTLNFANPYTYVTLVIFVLFVVTATLLAK